MVHPENKSEILYLEIDNIVIKIIFFPYFLEFAREELIRRIKVLYQGFLSQSESKKPDFIINFYHSHSVKNTKKKSTGEVFGFIYKYIAKNEIISVYTISIYEFQNIIYDCIVKLLPKKEILMIHSSGIEIDGKAYIFLGDSGAGKSTTVKLLGNKFKPLADDSGFILNKKNKYFYLQTPFYDKEWRIPKKNILIPLGGVFFLKKSAKFYFKPLTRKENIAKLVLRQVISEKNANRYSFKLALDFALSYSNFNYMYFGKDETKLIDLFNDLVIKKGNV